MQSKNMDMTPDYPGSTSCAECDCIAYEAIMKTLAEHDAEKMEIFRSLEQLNRTHVNGIACPNCGKELWDTNPTVLLTSYPPRKQISCIECGYAGTRLV